MGMESVAIGELARTMTTERRLARVMCSPLLVSQFLLGDVHTARSSLPKDVKVVGSYWDSDRWLLCFVVSSEEFDIVPETYVVPEIEVTFERLS
jgi:hypothetical protein